MNLCEASKHNHIAYLCMLFVLRPTVTACRRHERYKHRRYNIHNNVFTKIDVDSLDGGEYGEYNGLYFLVISGIFVAQDCCALE